MIEVAKVSELRRDGRKLIEINNKKIVLIFLSGEVIAIDAICPHQGGPLYQGSIEDKEITCPSHSFSFDLDTGNCINLPGFKVHKYKTQLDKERVMIEIN